ncbi:hypothetical protein T484DRAFT_1876700 [Baffinella frigidus]|nr:hypothetical protein T484DRAFT_1876700 [Cryptophyta sp. CCMP2293]
MPVVMVRQETSIPAAQVDLPEGSAVPPVPWEPSDQGESAPALAHTAKTLPKEAPFAPEEALSLRNGEHTRVLRNGTHPGRRRDATGSLAVLLPVTSRGTSEAALDKSLRALAESLPDGARVEIGIDDDDVMLSCKPRAYWQSLFLGVPRRHLRVHR